MLSERKVLLILDAVASATQLRSLLPRSGSTAVVTSQSDLASSFPRLHITTLEGLAVFPAPFTKRTAAEVRKVAVPKQEPEAGPHAIWEHVPIA